MVIGVLQLDLSIDHSGSLKDKRRVLKSLKDRLHREHQVSVAEVARHDEQQRGVLVVVLASADVPYAQGVLDRILEQLRRENGFVLQDHKMELLPGN
jgi:hypothetical protein